MGLVGGKINSSIYLRSDRNGDRLDFEGLIWNFLVGVGMGAVFKRPLFCLTFDI
jgi:hypothetical protein